MRLLQSNKNKFILGILLFFGLFILVLFAANIRIIDSGEVGVKLRNGKAVDNLQEGLHFQIPVFERVVVFNARVQNQEVEASSASKDLQDVNATVSLNFRINSDEATNIYRDLGIDYNETIVYPRLQESVKSVTARYTAEEIITKRPEVRENIFEAIDSKLKDEFFVIDDINIVNIQFSEEFTRAIEDKQLAQQNALKAKNDLERIKIEAEQRIVKAESEAEAQRALQRSITNEILLKLYIEKWDGKLPSVVSEDSGLLLDMNQLQQRAPSRDR